MLSNSSSLLCLFWDRAACSKSTADCGGDGLPADSANYHDSVRGCDSHPEMGGALVPLAVFGIVARTVALKGFEPFKALGALIIAVLLALFLHLLLPDPGAVWFLGKAATLPLRRVRCAVNRLLNCFLDGDVPITFQALRKNWPTNPPLP